MQIELLEYDRRAEEREINGEILTAQVLRDSTVTTEWWKLGASLRQFTVPWRKGSHESREGSDCSPDVKNLLTLTPFPPPPRF